MTLILNAGGIPEVPSAIAQRLRRLYGDQLALTWSAFEKCFQVRWAWPVNDRRWARVQSQEIPSDKAFDIVGRLPLDCPVDQAAAHLERALRTFPDDEVRKMANAVVDWNETEIPKQQTNALTEAVMSDDPTGVAPRQRKAAARRRGAAW